jgi:hypothetical protein
MPGNILIRLAQTSEDPPSKLNKCCRALERHDAISARAKGMGAVATHQMGQLIIQVTNSGFSR